jgi:hypothetical protein
MHRHSAGPAKGNEAMSKRLTDEELKFRHSLMHDVITALEFAANDGSGAVARKIQARFNKAVAAGRMTQISRGVYAITREYHDEMSRKNSAQPRSA